jgi:hypothetical protein
MGTRSGTVRRMLEGGRLLVPAYRRAYSWKRMRSVTVVTGLLCLAGMASRAYGAGTTMACAKSPYKIGDKATRHGPSGDQFYNRLRVTRIYVLRGKTDAKWCELGVPGSCGPEPQWYRETAGWLYKVQGKDGGNGRSYLWYSNGYEMDGPLGYVDTPLASAILPYAVRCE